MNTDTANAAHRDKVEAGLGTMTPAISTDRQGRLPHAISRIDVDAAKASPNNRNKKNQPPAPPVSGKTRFIVLCGAVFALICAEAWSAPTLFSLAEQSKAPKQLAWLLPAVLDGYAATSIWFGNNVPKAHPAHGPAIANTRLALLITVACNGVYHLLALAGANLPEWVHVALLVTVTALPIYITDRLVRMYKLADGTADAELVGADEKPKAPTKRVPTEAPPAPRTDRTADRGADVPTPSAPAADDADADADADVIDLAAAGAAAKRNTEQWAATVLPIYRHYITTHGGEEPNAPQLAEAIKAAGLGELGKSRARDVRKATELLHAATPWPDAGRSEAAR